MSVCKKVQKYVEKFLSSAEFCNQFEESWLTKLVSIANNSDDERLQNSRKITRYNNMD